MIGLQWEIIIIAILAAITCAILGVFLVLRKMSMTSDAISHAILPGIAIGFLITGTINSPLLIILAALMGLLTVAMTEAVTSTRLVKEDAATGLVFPALFSIGVILISKYASNIHIDTDSVLLGEIAFAPFDRLVIRGIDIGPKSFWVLGTTILLNLLFVLVFFKELKLSTFDSNLAATFGFMPILLNYMLMGLVSITIVSSFEAVGVILVIALLIAPAATSYLLNDNLKNMITLSVIFGIISALAGYWIARWLDASIAGMMATVSGLIFFLVYLLAPGQGLVASVRRRQRQKLEFAQMTLAMHIYNHSDDSENIEERMKGKLGYHLGWSVSYIEKIVKRSQNSGIITVKDDLISITSKGIGFVEAANMLISSKYHPSFQRLRNEFIIFTGN
ncbi:MAG: metal ABC transporter permease [Bacteroidales bacterium]|jgi:manganese/zinc/iron transport system permease protein|nr:metal ABC transporter permease [Bacteroidales bacterium]MBP7874301.1 metal ABC transporter permease [Bacteroidales bacterium]MCZ2281505.1 metal ABC transporter permease [Bacteroidales bacterium]